MGEGAVDEADSRRPVRLAPVDPAALRGTGGGVTRSDKIAGTGCPPAFHATFTPAPGFYIQWYICLEGICERMAHFL